MYIMSRRSPKFPMFAVVLLIVAVVWFLSELGLWAINVPWIPLIVIIVAIGFIYNRVAR